MSHNQVSPKKPFVKGVKVKKKQKKKQGLTLTMFAVCFLNPKLPLNYPCFNFNAVKAKTDQLSGRATVTRSRNM